MAKLRINGDSSGYVDLEAPNAASSSTLDLDQVPQKNAANTFSAVNKFTNSVAIGGTHSPVNNLDVRSTGQAIVRVDGVGLYFNGIKIRNNYSSVQSDWNVGAAGGTSGWGSANGTFIVRDDTTNSTGLEIEQGAGSNTAALHINSSGYVTTPSQPAFHADAGAAQTVAGTVQFTGVMTNNGNHYNTSTYTFTAPVTGIYKFSARIMKAQDATVDFHFRVNGSQAANNLYDTATATNQLNSGTINMVRHLNSNDSVTVYSASTSGTNWIHAGHREFTGFLIG